MICIQSEYNQYRIKYIIVYSKYLRNPLYSFIHPCTYIYIFYYSIISSIQVITIQIIIIPIVKHSGSNYSSSDFSGSGGELRYDV